MNLVLRCARLNTVSNGATTGEDLLSTRQVAELAGVTVQTVSRWARDKGLTPAWRSDSPGDRGARVYRRADVEAFLSMEQAS